MAHPVIVSALRTPIGNFLGGLSNKTAPQLASTVLKTILKKTKLAQVDEVIMGNCLQAGVGQNSARQAALYAKLPNKTPAFTVNKVCGSGIKAVMLAADKIRLGDAEVILAGGMESMSNAPHLLREGRCIQKYGSIEKKQLSKLKGNYKLIDSMIYDGLWDCFYSKHMGNICTKTVKEYKISRQEQDKFALQSHQRAIAARKKFQEEIVPVNKRKVDEHPREDTSLEKLSKLPAVFGKTITAGNASSLNDGAAALMITSEKFAKKKKLLILGKIKGYTKAFQDPNKYTTAPVPAVKKLLKQTKTKLKDIDLVELNEAYAAQSIAVQRDLKLKDSKLNVNGGAVALGHPIGASGARILVTLLHEMKRRNSKRGIATLCLGGGGATAMLISK